MSLLLVSQPDTTAIIFSSPIVLGLLASIFVVLKYLIQILTSRPNEDKALKIEFGVAILIALTFLISFIVFELTHSIMSSMTVFIFMLPSMAVLYAIVYAFLEYWRESTPQPNSQSSGQSNPPPATPTLPSQNLAQTHNPLSDQGHGSSTNEDKAIKIVCTVTFTVVLTFLINFFIVALTLHNPYFYSMYLKPGIYVFMPNGNYYYYHPLGWPASNVTLIVLGGGDIDINDWVYPDTVTVQPGNYSFMITLTNPDIILNYFINTIPTSALISLIIAMILCKLVARSEKH